MISPRLTRCPKCNTSFRVTQMQLRAANGSVRCGSCLEVFDALENMARDEQPNSPEATPKTPPPPEKTHSSTREVKLSETVAKDNVIEITHQKKSEESSEKAKQADLKVETAKEKKTKAESKPDNLHRLFQSIDKDYLNIEEEADIKKQNRKGNLKVLSWTAAILLAMTTFGLQYLWFNKNALSTINNLRPAYLWTCQQLGCELPDRINIKAMKSLQLMIRTHPDHNKGLVIDSVIINEAAFPQPWPGIELLFTDINDQPVASRLFRPSEYLGGTLAGSQNIPTHQPVRLSIEILDPGKSAVNYQLRFHQN